MEILVAEVVGTAILVLLGNGVVANVVLKGTKGNSGGWIVITTGWGLAVAVAVYCVGQISGAHINPAVTLGLLSIGQVEAALVPQYLFGQFLGGFIGAVLVWMTYKPHWAATEDQADKLACFSTGPAIPDAPWNLFAEFIGTAVLVFGVLSIGTNFSKLPEESIDLATAFSTGINPLLVGILVWSLGLSLGGPTGYAINPARDLAPRLAHALLPISGKGGSNWGYAWIPVVGPVAGGVIGALLFRSLGY